MDDGSTNGGARRKSLGVQQDSNSKQANLNVSMGNHDNNYSGASSTMIQSKAAKMYSIN